MKATAQMRIGVDLMGADAPPDQMLKAAVDTLSNSESENTKLTLFGDPSLEEILPKSNASLSYVSSQETVLMTDEPLKAVRRKKDSSMIQGILALRRGEIDAFISSGNTGALVAAASIHLPRLSSSIERAPLLTLMPTTTGSVVVVDVGGRVICEARHLFQYALLGAAFQRSYAGIQAPAVGLLNIGEESIKGREEHRQAYLQLQDFVQDKQNITFYGNVEGHEVFLGAVDVLVTDGFTGNVFLKTAEGISGFVLKTLQQSFNPLNAPREELGAIKVPLDTIHAHLDYSEYPGAVLCGLDGLVLKCHGGSPSHAIKSAIQGASRMIANDLLSHLKQEISFLVEKD